MSTKRISVDLAEALHRHFKAKAAYEDTTMKDVLGDLIDQWVGTWGTNTLSHTVVAGEDLHSIAAEHYGDPELYLAIAYFNDMNFPELLQPGAEILVPEPGTAPVGLTPKTVFPFGVDRSTASVEIDADLARRFKARAAFEGSTMTAWLHDFVVEWVGDWPTQTQPYTVTSGDSLGTIAFRFYNDASKYMAIAYFNDIRNVNLIHVGQQLIIPEPLTLGQLASGESPYIFGIHDQGGEHLMASKDKKGWVLISEKILADPQDASGRDYTALADEGFGVIVRLNHDYHPGGTIPFQDDDGQNHQNFAVRCGNFVQSSPGCHIWIIGNEMNHPQEWPMDESDQPQMIIPQMYTDCFKRCHGEIHGRPGHEEDQVVVGAVAPWPDRAKYPGNERGDWVQYLADVLKEVKGQCDGIAIHTYTHGKDRRLITSPGRMAPPFQDRYLQFWAYRDFMEAIPASMRGLPVYITETDQNDGWARENTGWVQAAYAEIDKWNEDLARQKIRCLILYRWEIYPGDIWHFRDVREVQDDLRAALDHDYRWWK